MSTRLNVAALVLVVVIGWIATQSFFVIQETEQALLVRLGMPVVNVQEPGLHLKMPFLDTYVIFKRQLLPLEPPSERIILGDQKRIEVQTYAKFRIADPLRFYQSYGTEAQARASVVEVISTAVRRELGKITLPSLLTNERSEVMARVQADVSQQEVGNGIEIVNVRLLRADLPVETSQAIYDRMMSERVRQAKELRAQGFERAQLIRSKADRERTILLSVAQRDSETLRGIADAEANDVVTKAYRQDAHFFDIYRTLRLYRSAFAQSGPTLVLSPTSDLMRFFQSAPKAIPEPEKTVTVNPTAEVKP